MRVLFILTELPYPANRNGIALINHELLVRAPVDVHLDLFITNADESADVAPLKASAPRIGQVHFSSEPLARKYRVGNLLTGVLFGRNLFTQPGVREFLRKNSDHYDAVYVAPLMSALDFRLATPLFLNAVDSFARLNENAYRRTGRWRDLIKLHLYRIYERRMLRQAELVNFVSSVDLEAVRHSNPSLALVNISNGVDATVFHPDPSRRQPGRLLFTGNFDYAPNAEAARFLALQIFPRVRALVPDATLQIVGRNPPTELIGLPGVLVTGFVEDIVSCYQEAEVFACSLLSGAGVKNKILEALACGLPIVTTALGVDGIEHLQAGRHYLLADDRETFASQIAKVLLSAESREALGHDAREVAMRHLSWEPIVQSYFAQFRGLATGVAEARP